MMLLWTSHQCIRQKRAREERCERGRSERNEEGDRRQQRGGGGERYPVGVKKLEVRYKSSENF
jgi:hypothetical protein